MTAIGVTTAKPPANAGAVGSAADSVRRVAKALLAAHDVTPAELALRLGVGKTAIYNRLSGEKPFTIDETAAMAEYFHVPVGVFFAGPAALFGNVPESRAGGRAGLGGRDEGEPGSELTYLSKSTPSALARVFNLAEERARRAGVAA